jgi:hypothetical protein
MISSLVEFGLLAAGLAAALTLFVSLKQEISAQARKNRARMDTVLQRLQDAGRRSPENGAPQNEVASPHAAFRSGMNLNRRVQAERLLRRGEDVGHVAAALGVPRREIELLIHVQKLSARRASGAGG